MTGCNNYLIFNFSEKPESAGWKTDGNFYCYEDCSCVLRHDRAEITKPWFSVTPLFYSFQRGLLLVSRSWLELAELLKENKVGNSTDSFFIRSYLQYQSPFTNHTLSSEIKYLRGGESVCIEGDAVKTGFKHFGKDNHDYHEEEFRVDIKESLKKIDFRRTSFQLSSGLDSSILAIIAAGLTKNRDLNFVTCITKGRGCSDEVENVRRLSGELNANLQLFDFSGIDIFAEGETLIRKCLGYPIAHPSHLVEFLLDREVSKQFDFIVAGRGPDECLAGYEWHKGKFSDPMLHRKRLTVTDSFQLSRLLKQRGPDSYSQYDVCRGSSRILSLRDRLKYDLLTISESWIIISDAVSNCFDIKIISPFLNRKVRRGMFFLPDPAKLDSENGKAFMRKAFKDAYPEYILNFPKQGLRLDLKAYFDDYSCDEIFNKINVNPDFINAYFDISGIKELIVKTKENVCNYGWQIWSIYLLALSAEILKSK